MKQDSFFNDLMWALVQALCFFLFYHPFVMLVLGTLSICMLLAPKPTEAMTAATFIPVLLGWFILIWGLLRKRHKNLSREDNVVKLLDVGTDLTLLNGILLTRLSSDCWLFIGATTVIEAWFVFACVNVAWMLIADVWL